MAKLSTAQRKALPSSEFAGPGRSYPIPNRSHGANAKARAAQAVKAGRMSKGREQRIDAKVDRKFPGMGRPKAKRSGKKLGDMF